MNVLYQRATQRFLSTKINSVILDLFRRDSQPLWPDISRVSRLRSSRAFSAQVKKSQLKSVLDDPPQLVRAGKKKHRAGLALLIAIPVTAFGLGSWQVQRLQWKTNLIAMYEDRLARPPLALPPVIDISAIDEFDYRRVLATGRFRHDQEMLIGPRIRDGQNGFQVVTPLERFHNASTILVNRGWISKNKMDQATRKGDLPMGPVKVEGLLRRPWKKNIFTPGNRPDKSEFYFPDINQMANLVGAQAVWIEETMALDLVASLEREAKGIPIGRPADINLRNNHLQYIFTWYSLSVATTLMLYLLLRTPSSSLRSRVRHSKDWI